MELIMIASHFGYDLVAKRKLTARKPAGGASPDLVATSPRTLHHYAPAFRRVTTAG
jgi:hypothetical protein